MDFLACLLFALCLFYAGSTPGRLGNIMSVPKLPVMSYDVLSAMPAGSIGYATTISHAPIGSADYVAIFHHGSLIAEVWRGGVWLSNAGYNTSTTSQRLNKVLRDNLPGTVYSVAIRNRIISVVDHVTRPAKDSIIAPVGRGIFVYDNGDVKIDGSDLVIAEVA